MKFTILLSLFAVWAAFCADLAAADGDSNNSETQLHKAVKDGDVSGVNNLIKSGENVNAIDDHKNTPLHLLGGINDSDNQVVIAELLVNAGADVNAKNLYDKTPVDLATTNQIKDVLNKNVAKN